MRARLILGLLGCAASAWGGYSYDFNNTGSYWASNGSSAQTQSIDDPDGNWYGGYTSWTYFPTSASRILTQTVPGASPNDYEVRSALAVGGASNTTLVHFLRASSTTVMAGTGSYISVEVQAISVSAGILNINQCVNGSVTQLSSTSIQIASGLQLRTVIYGTNLLVLTGIDTGWGSYTGPGAMIWNLVVSQQVPLTTGSPGIGSYQPGGGSNSNDTGFLGYMVGHHDTVAPTAVSHAGIATSAFPNDVSLRWPLTTDDANGVGVWQYLLKRDDVPNSQISISLHEIDDATVAPNTTYTWEIGAEDFHGNTSWTPITITTPPAQAIDPHRPGMRSTGSYWGGGGEQIDTLSGNLNFAIPLGKVTQRTGGTIPLNLVYNSQNWRQDGGANWQLSADLGVGYGWRMQIGSLTPYYNSWVSGVHHYVFTDGTGAEYRLMVNNGGVWSSTDGLHLWFDSNSGRMHFPDGSWWQMGCTSASTEPDAGSLYPTLIEEVNGNQIAARYLPVLSNVYLNASSRLAGLAGPTDLIMIVWNTDTPVPHATSVTSSTATFGLHYTATAPMSPPFGTDPAFSGVTTTQLTSVSTPAQNSYTFSYDSSGSNELTQVTFPYGGHLRWTYANDSYNAGRMLRAVSNRYLAADSAGATEWSYGISRDNASGATVHGSMTLADASGIGSKTWNFTTANSSAPWQTGLLAQFAQQAAQGGTVLQRDTYTWSQDAGGNPYISAKQSVMNEGTANQTSAVTQQTLDQYGNVTQSVQYPYNSTATPALKLFNNTYLTGTSYAANYIFNRLASATVSYNGGATQTPVANYYDGSSCPASVGTCPGYFKVTSGAPTGSGWQYVAGFDTTNALPFASRGLVSYRVTPAQSASFINYDTGSMYYALDQNNGVLASYSSDSTVNYSAPTSISSQSYSESISYTPWLAVTQTTGANGETMIMGYDAWGRPATGVGRFGEVITYSYSANGVSPVTQTQTTNASRAAKRTTLDGVGRAIRVETGTMSGSTFTIVSTVDTVYGPCACSPLAKISKVSMPYSPGSTPVWTVYTYDGMGRTLAVQQPDGASTTTTSYAGNQTTTTDPAGNWKQFTTDVSGNITTVVEPDPSSASGGTLATSYAYDWMNHVTLVTMTRGGVTQTRTFVYDNFGNLTSATNPENGTFLYYYNANNTLQYKHDARGQDTVYTYDVAKRVTMIQRYPTGTNNAEDTCQRVTYQWDSATVNGVASTGAINRIAAATYYACAAGFGTSFTDQYSYHSAGAVTSKRQNVYRPPTYDDNGYQLTPGIPTRIMSAIYGYNTQGKVSSVAYPGKAFTYSFDNVGRPVTLTDGGGWGYDPDSGYPGTSLQWVNNVQYDYAGRMTSLQYLTSATNIMDSPPTTAYETESMTYNVNGQLTSLGWSGTVTGTIQYLYSATQNNGQITQTVDGISGETISYQYDALKRLVSASSTPNTGSSVAAWNEAYAYDGFGNLTGKSFNGGSNLVPGVNAATNRLTSGFFDANGNMTSGAGGTFAYDVANRMVSAQETGGGVEYYGYAPDNKQVYRMLPNGSEQVTLYGASGEKLAVYGLQYSGTPILGTNVYFAGKMIWSDGVPAYQDRLGTNRASGARFRPYGDEITSTANDREKFATYTRDSYTGLDYADQRYYASTYGRFNTADPYQASGGPSDPSSWNRYSYVTGDPVNRRDPTGLYEEGDSSDPCSDDPTMIGCLPASERRSGGGHGHSTFATAVDRLNGAVDGILERTSVSPDCQTDMDSLSKAAGTEIDLATIQIMLVNTTFQNGVGSNLPISALGGPGAAAYGAALQNAADAKYGPGQTIGNDFARNPTGLTADTVLGGSTIFINPGIVSGSLPINEGLLLHESLHEFGLIDQQVQQALGFADYNNVSNTKRISTKLQQDCVTGKGNN